MARLQLFWVLLSLSRAGSECLSILGPSHVCDGHASITLFKSNYSRIQIVYTIEAPLLLNWSRGSTRICKCNRNRSNISASCIRGVTKTHSRISPIFLLLLASLFITSSQEREKCVAKFSMEKTYFLIVAHLEINGHKMVYIYAGHGDKPSEIFQMNFSSIPCPNNVFLIFFDRTGISNPGRGHQATNSTKESLLYENLCQNADFARRSKVREQIDPLEIFPTHHPLEWSYLKGRWLQRQELIHSFFENTSWNTRWSKSKERRNPISVSDSFNFELPVSRRAE